ncbi:lipopolysaccharide biosynthesis protein [Ancylobacter moscoviensis]|uniref:lipopolysaccharide biosynthesis protein n=1 Tax=Ancylobacter moscoviensis TaxID=2597768 RepID=UPI001FED5613|nr:lipopolysaccharide biosynthesis protein [Ancylobacter moscoviensis]
MGTMMDPNDISVNTVAPSPDEANVEPGDAIRTAGTLRHLRRLLFGPAIAALLVAGATSQIATPRYTAQARVWSDHRSFAAGRDGVQVLSSREFARQVIESHNLAARLANPLGEPANALSGAVSLAGFAAPPEPMPASREALALRTIERGLSVRDAGNGQIAVDFVSPDPRLSADVANAFARNYLELRETRGPFSMDPNGATAAPSPAPVRIIASAVPSTSARWPTPLISSLATGIGTFLLVLGFQAFARRRASTGGQEIGAVPMPELAPQTMQHLPWIGAATGDYADETESPRPFRRFSRERELADLSRLVELRGEAARLVIVTGATADEGIARCAISLGRSLSGAAERRVVIVCLDVAAEPLDALAADPRAPGLTDLLFGVASFSDAIHRENGSRCHVIPPGRGAREASGLVASDRLPLILTALKQTYDHVVVAAPPLGRTEGAERIAALDPTTILVTHPGAMATDAVQAFDALAAQGFGDIAMVTFTPETEAGSLPRAA